MSWTPIQVFMHPAFFVVTLAMVASAVHSPPSSHVVHETRAIEPRHWVKTRRLDSNWVLPMRFGLAQRNLHKLEEMLMSVSHPKSPSYGQHFTPQEVVDAFAPTKETLSAVTDWLVDSGISRDRLRLSANKGWIHVNASTYEVENLLKTEYHVYAHPSGDSQIGCHNYSLPSHLRKHVDLIKPTVHFKHQPTSDGRLEHSLSRSFARRDSNPKKSSNSKRGDPPMSFTCIESAIDPGCVRHLYQFNYTAKATYNNSFAIVELPPSSYIASDLDMFFGQFAPELVNVRPNIVLLDKGASAQVDNNIQYLGEESSVDLEYAMALASPTTITLLQVGEVNTGADAFNIWLDKVDEQYCDWDSSLPGSNADGSCSISPLSQVPHVVSVSYARKERELTIADASRECLEYAKLGMMGTSVFYSVGDSGVGTCLDGNVQPNSDNSPGAFVPFFPASCPWVTSVGATVLQSAANDLETAWDSSAGGFSNYFELPQYQRDAVHNYSQTYLTPSPFPSGLFNDSLKARAYPDISALSGPYVCFANGTITTVMGTSLSAPVVASMFTMINDARLAMGQRVIGFINPILYTPAFAPAFHDITSGSNPGCGQRGFNATPGWDPVTGVGTPNFQNLLNLFNALASLN